MKIIIHNTILLCQTAELLFSYASEVPKLFLFVYYNYQKDLSIVNKSRCLNTFLSSCSI